MSFFSRQFSRKQNSQSHILALDIGTEFIKALIFKVNYEKEVAEVIGVGRQRQKPTDMQGGIATDISGVALSSEKAIERAYEMCDVKPTQAILGIAGELVKGSTTTVHYQRGSPKSKIDLPELKNIVQKIQWKAFDNVRKELSWETCQNEMDVKLINAVIVNVRIDGYRVTNPLGFQGKDISISIFNAYAPLVHLGALQTIAQDLGLDLLTITAEPYAVAKATGIEEDLDFSAIFIDMGGGTTDVAVVRNGGMEGIKMFALGGRAFTKRLVTKFNISFTEAEDKKIKYSAGLLPKNEAEKIKNLFKNDLEVWATGVELSLSEFSSTELLPSKILLCGGASALPGVRQVLQSEEWTEKLPMTKKPSIHFIKPSDITNIVDKTSLLVDQQDITPMALANLSLDFSGTEKILPGILRRVVKMMQT